MSKDKEELKDEERLEAQESVETPEKEPGHLFVFPCFLNKKYIYTMYIYRKCDDLCKKWSLSYGYPMVILWVSYGIVSL